MINLESPVARAPEEGPSDTNAAWSDQYFRELTDPV